MATYRIRELNIDRFITCLKKSSQDRNEEDLAIIYLHLRNMQAMSGLPDTAVRAMCLTSRYEVHDSNHLLYKPEDYASCWYILLSGSVFIDGRMFLPGSSFGKQPHGYEGLRGSECLILEQSEMIVIDYPDVNLLQPYSRGSCPSVELEKLLALETDEVKVGKDSQDEQLPVELQHVKDMLIRYESNLSENKHPHPYAEEHVYSIANNRLSSRSSGDMDLDLSGLVESIVDSDEEESSLPSSQESLMVRDVVRDCLEKEPLERTETDIQALLDFMQHLPAFSNMTLNVRRALCEVMVFAVVDKAGSLVMQDGEELDSWCVILNGSVEIMLDGQESETLHLGDSFGVKATLEKMYHRGIMKTRVDDCQFVCIAQEDYYRILHQGEENTSKVEEEGEIVMVTEHRVLEGGNRQGHVVIKGTAERLIQHLVEDHTIIDPTYVEDFLLTYRTFYNKPMNICNFLWDCFQKPTLRDRVTRVMLLWVNNHYTDFEENADMMDFLEKFEKGLEKERMGGQLRLLNIARATKSKKRVVTVNRPSRDSPIGFNIQGGKERGFGIFVTKVDEGSKAEEAGLFRGDQIQEANGQTFEHLSYIRAMEVLMSTTHLSLVVKQNMLDFKEMLISPGPRVADKKNLKNQDPLSRSLSDVCEKKSSVKPRLSQPDISLSGTNNNTLKKVQPSVTTYGTAKLKKALLRITALQRNSRSEKDLSSIDSGLHNGNDEYNPFSRAYVKPQYRSTSSLPSAMYSSVENIHFSTAADHAGENPDQVIKVYRSDQTCRYFVIFRDTTAQEIVNMAIDGFGITDGSDYSLCEVIADTEGLIKQKRLHPTLNNLSERIHLNGRYYIKNNQVTEALITDEAAQELARESTINLLHLGTHEVAKELTLQDFDIFSSVDTTEYIDDLWNNDERLRREISKFADIANKEMFWVATEVCKEHIMVRRMKLLKHFIKIARLCKEYKNFNSMFAIISGLGHASVRRLKSTWDKLPSKHNKTFEDLQDLMDPSRNMSKYRNLLNSDHVTAPVIPFFPVIKKDLTFLHLGNDSFVDGLVNFEKLRMISKEIREINKLSSMPYDMSTEASSGARGLLSSYGSGSNRSSRRGSSQVVTNPKKLYEEALMNRRVSQYLSGLQVEEDEDKLRDMSQVCEQPTGGYSTTTQTRKKSSPQASPAISNHNPKHKPPHGPSPLGLRKFLVNGERASVSSASSLSTSSPGHSEPSSPKIVIDTGQEEIIQRVKAVLVLPPDNHHSKVEPTNHVECPQDTPNYPTDQAFEYSDSTVSSQDPETSPSGSTNSLPHQENYSTFQYGGYPSHVYKVEYVEDFDEEEEGQISAV